MCFINASKAVNQVNHKQLFIKIKQGGGGIAYWYARQKMNINIYLPSL